MTVDSWVLKCLASRRTVQSDGKVVLLSIISFLISCDSWGNSFLGRRRGGSRTGALESTGAFLRINSDPSLRVNLGVLEGIGKE